ncbi:MAG: hypothetical protein QMD09_15035 [Desulfatibacillaceae bacterium]|nr:hypothetical protein [Desulfatibacillaceae bacterium]
MTRLNKGLLLIFAAVCILAWHPAAFAQDAPVVYAPQPEYEFEPVSEGTKISHEFVLQNKGLATLVIERILTG